MDIDRIRGLVDELYDGNVRVTKEHVVNTAQGKGLDRDTMLALEGMPNESYSREELLHQLDLRLGSANLTDLSSRVR